MQMNLNTPDVIKQVLDATRLGLRDTIIEIADDAIDGSPVQYGTNRRSIKYEVGPSETAKDLEAATFSTSGYGGFLEVGTVKMGARPYFRPSLDRHGKDLGKNIKGHMK